jgi:hypothetical protein
MSTVMRSPTADLARAADELVRQYPAAPARETEKAIALLGLWALEGVAAGQIHPHEAAGVFAGLDAGLAEQATGPELSEDAAQLVVEAIHLHHGIAPWPGVDMERFRVLAFTVLHGDAETANS